MNKKTIIAILSLLALAGAGYGFDFAAYEKDFGRIIEDAALRADARTGGMNKLSRQTAQKTNEALAEKERGLIEMFCDWKAATLRHNDAELVQP